MTDPLVRQPPDDRSNRSLLQRRAEWSLAQHPYRAELRGSFASLAWPRLCPYCGGQAAVGIDVPKIFRWPRPRGRHVPNGGVLRVHVARIPFCADCAERHRTLVVRPTMGRKIFHMLVTPLMIPVIGSAWMLTKTIPAASDASVQGKAWLFAWGLVALPIFIIVWTLILAWRASLPQRIEKQTEITLACDFSGHVGSLFEGERHIYAIRDRGFAEAFLAANADRVWTPEDDARSSRRQLIGLGALVAVLVCVWLFVVVVL